MFQGEASEQRLKQLVNYNYWHIQQDPKLKTIGYVLFIDYENSYSVNFSWSQSKLKKNSHIFQCGTVTCKFIVDSGEFSEQPAASQTNHIILQVLSLEQVHKIDSNKSFSNDSDRSIQKNYRFILPRVSFQQLNRCFFFCYIINC